FSSRRRHTRSKRDWSSDVCSSDLLVMRKIFSIRLSSTGFPGFVPNPIPLPITTSSLPFSSKADIILLLMTFSITIKTLCLCLYRSEERRVGKKRRHNRQHKQHHNK